VPRKVVAVNVIAEGWPSSGIVKAEGSELGMIVNETRGEVNEEEQSCRAKSWADVQTREKQSDNVQYESTGHEVIGLAVGAPPVAGTVAIAFVGPAGIIVAGATIAVAVGGNAIEVVIDKTNVPRDVGSQSMADGEILTLEYRKVDSKRWKLIEYESIEHQS
jgi:hypothetical protein